MSNKIKNIKTKITKFTKVSKNIFVNASKEMLNSHKLDKVKSVTKEYKSVLIVASIILFFILKNMYTLGAYNLQIKASEQEVIHKQAINTQLKEDLEYYKTDEFILRYAIEELNLRPTKENKLFHGTIKPVAKDTSDEENINNEETIADGETTNNKENNASEIETDIENSDTTQENE